MCESKETFYGHLRVVEDTPEGERLYGKGGLTVAFKLTPGGVAYATARCNLMDNFDKKRGRTIASGRLEKGKFTLCPVDTTDMSPGQVADLILAQAVRPLR